MNVSYAPMKPGDRVIICFNPHHEGASGIVGTVVTYRPAAGHGGCDLVDVRYTHMAEGKEYTMPFARANLSVVDSKALITLAKLHGIIAAKLWALAGESIEREE